MFGEIKFIMGKFYESGDGINFMGMVWKWDECVGMRTAVYRVTV